MIQETITLMNPSGLHARPASKFCAIARKFNCMIQIEFDDQRIDAKMILDVMAANLKQGASVHLICEGDDEIEAMAALTSFLAVLVD